MALRVLGSLLLPIAVLAEPSRSLFDISFSTAPAAQASKEESAPSAPITYDGAERDEVQRVQMKPQAQPLAQPQQKQKQSPPFMPGAQQDQPVGAQRPFVAQQPGAQIAQAGDDRVAKLQAQMQKAEDDLKAEASSNLKPKEQEAVGGGVGGLLTSLQKTVGGGLKAAESLGTQAIHKLHAQKVLKQAQEEAVKLQKTVINPAEEKFVGEVQELQKQIGDSANNGGANSQQYENLKEKLAVAKLELKKLKAEAELKKVKSEEAAQAKQQLGKTTKDDDSKAPPPFLPPERLFEENRLAPAVQKPSASASALPMMALPLLACAAAIAAGAAVLGLWAHRSIATRRAASSDSQEDRDNLEEGVE